MYQQNMLLEFRKSILKYTPNKYHVHWFSSFKHLKLPISIKIPLTIYLDDSYIFKFEFMNYLFAHLLIVWMYMVCVYVREDDPRALAPACNWHCAMFNIGISTKGAII